ncbi:MAG: TonB-dependent receptor [Halioglobus sp.]
MSRLPFPLAIATLVLLPGPALSAPMLEEVIVTAERREQSLQDVPISIAAFSEDTLEKMGVYDIKGLASKVPNVVVNEFTGSSTTVRLFIRGVGQNDVQVTQDPSVALYMDGVYIGSSVGTAFESADIQRVEILRGPQGTLYGRNATGGAINLITNRASNEELTFRQRLTYGDFGEFRSRSILNLPLTDAAAVKLAYSYSERDALVENPGAGEDWGIEERDNITADIHWDLADNVTLDYKYDRSSIEDSSRLSQVLGFDFSSPAAGVIQFENPALRPDGQPVDSSADRLDKATSFDAIAIGDVEIDAHTLNLEWTLSDALTLRSITGYRDVSAFTQNSQTPVTSLFGTFSVTDGQPDTRFEQLSQEFQLLGSSETLNWVAGLYYYEDESSEDNLGSSNGSEALPEGVLVDFTSTENTSIALFGQATWSPASLESWHFTLGARYSDDNRKAFRDNNRVSFGLGGAPTSVPPFRANYDRDFDEFNPSFTVEYDLNEDANVYAKLVTAYKSGGTSQRSTTEDNFLTGFEPEDLVSYELGYKGDLANGRVRFNAALFYMEYEGYQQSVQTGRNAGERDFINIDDADIAGLEFDLTAALTDSLTGTLSYGYLDAKFGTDTVSYEQIDDNAASGVSTVTEELTENLALAPEHSITASLDYLRPLSFGVLQANVNMQYQDEANGGVQIPTGVLNDRTLLAATLGIADIALGNAGTLRISLWGENLLDEEYHIGNIRQATFDTLGFTSGLATFGDPRTYGITLEYEFN